MVTEARRRRVHQVVSNRQQGVVVLEDIHDPHNAAASFRSCEAFGFQRVCLIFEQEEPFNPRKEGKATSASANKWLDFCIYGSTEACLNDLKGEGYELIATVVDPQAESIFEARFETPKIALLFGNEHRGLSPKAVEMADRRVTIPMVGMVRSLNLSVTVALFLYEVTRQRRVLGMERYLLPPEERERLVQDFLQRAEG